MVWSSNRLCSSQKRAGLLCSPSCCCGCGCCFPGDQLFGDAARNMFGLPNHWTYKKRLPNHSLRSCMTSINWQISQRVIWEYIDRPISSPSTTESPNTKKNKERPLLRNIIAYLVGPPQSYRASFATPNDWPKAAKLHGQSGSDETCKPRGFRFFSRRPRGSKDMEKKTKNIAWFAPRVLEVNMSQDFVNDLTGHLVL